MSVFWDTVIHIQKNDKDWQWHCNIERYKFWRIMHNEDSITQLLSGVADVLGWASSASTPAPDPASQPAVVVLLRSTVDRTPVDASRCRSQPVDSIPSFLCRWGLLYWRWISSTALNWARQRDRPIALWWWRLRLFVLLVGSNLRYYNVLVRHGKPHFFRLHNSPKHNTGTSWKFTASLVGL